MTAAIVDYDYEGIRQDVQSSSTNRLWELSRLPLVNAEATWRYCCVVTELSRRGQMQGGAPVECE